MNFNSKKFLKKVSALLAFNLLLLSVPFKASALDTSDLDKQNQGIIAQVDNDINIPVDTPVIEEPIIEKKVENVQAVPIAAVYFIPGIGEVALTATGVFLVGGIAVNAGTWVYNKIQHYFAEKDYEDARDQGIRTKNHGESHGSSLPRTGRPLSSQDLINNDGVKQRRYYDEDGNADVDIDYRHGGEETHTFPHKHKWDGTSRGKWQPL